MASEFAYKLTDKAVADLDEIAAYISVQLGNPQAASALLNALQAVIQETCFFPESGAPVVNDFLSYRTIRKKLISSYVMYYYPDMTAETILILRVLYGRRDLDKLLRDMDGGLPHNDT